MSLDDRLRIELRSVEPGELREDDALDSVLRKYDRGLALGRVTRQALAVAVVVSLFAAVGMVVAWRNTPEHSGAASASDRYRSTITIRVARTSGTRDLALAPSTRRNLLLTAHLSPDDSQIDFRATLNPSGDALSLTVTAPTKYESETITRRWASASDKALRTEANRVLNRRVRYLHQRLGQIDAELVRIDPNIFKGRPLGYGMPHPFTDNEPPPSVPPSASTHEFNLVNERVQLLSSLADLGARAARNGPPARLTPDVLVPQTAAVRVHTSSPSKTTPVLVSWAIGLVVVLGGALFVFRRRTRSTRQVAA
jgi:hypothetical protein